VLKQGRFETANRAGMLVQPKGKATLDDGMLRELFEIIEPALAA
jgi:hypothetical protein